MWPQRMREPLRKIFLDPQMNRMMEEAQTEVETLEKDQQFEVQPYDPEFEVRLKRWHAEIPEGKTYTTAEEVLEKMLIHYEVFPFLPCLFPLAHLESGLICVTYSYPREYSS